MRLLGRLPGLGQVAALWLAASLRCAGADRVGGAVVEYSFPRSECLAGAFSDSSGNDFFGQLQRRSPT